VFLQGRLHQAYSLCQHVLILAEQEDIYSKGLPVLAYAYATMSIVEREWNHVESALAFAHQSVALAEQWRQADTFHYTLTCLTEALWAAGDLEGALATNQRAMQLAVNVSPWYYKLSAYEEILLNLAKGELTAAAHRFAEVEPTFDEQNKKGTYLKLKASLLNAQGRFSDTLLTVEPAIGEIAQKGKMWLLMSLLPLQALALQAMGREEEALQVISRCLEFAAPEGYVRIFVERGAPMHRLLQTAASRGIHTEYIQGLLPAFQISEPVQQPVRQTARPIDPRMLLVEPLSEREVEVLRMLDSSLTSEEIARELYISTNTARTHIRNIYSKLDVHGRIEAIQKAKELGLI
jgi:LuxR family maltose regulon positive regulatory protein